MNQNQPIVAVDVDGKTAQWDGNVFSGDPTLVAEALLSVEIEASYLLGQVQVTADEHSALAAAAALASYRPGRTNFTVLPEDVANILASGHTDPEEIG